MMRSKTDLPVQHIDARMAGRAIRRGLTFSWLCAAVLCPRWALAQGCAMCRTVAESSTWHSDGFNASILFLAGMPYILIAAVGVWIYFHRPLRGFSSPES